VPAGTGTPPIAGRKLSNIARQERVGKRFRRADSIAGKSDLP
jgi:hypothetical protein